MTESGGGRGPCSAELPLAVPLGVVHVPEVKGAGERGRELIVTLDEGQRPGETGELQRVVGRSPLVKYLPEKRVDRGRLVRVGAPQVLDSVSGTVGLILAASPVRFPRMRG